MPSGAEVSKSRTTECAIFAAFDTSKGGAGSAAFLIVDVGRGDLISFVPEFAWSELSS